MSHALRSLPVILIVGMLLAAGCGDNDEQTPRFNENLGDSPIGAPIGTGPIDAGILQDQTSYKPTAFEPLDGVTPAAGAGGATASGEAADAKAAVDRLIDSSFAMDVDVMLDGFVPGQVAALREDPCMQAIYDVTDALGVFTRIVREKGTGPEFQASNELADALPLLAGPIKNAIRVDVLDEENAVATLAVGRLEIPDELKTKINGALEQIMAMASSGGAPPAGEAPKDPNSTPPEGAQAAPVAQVSLDAILEANAAVEIPLPLKKVNDEWRLALPFSFNEEQAELIAEGLGIVNETLGGVTQQISAVETLDMQNYMQILMQAQGSAGLRLMGWSARAKTVFGPLLETGAAEGDGAAKPADGGEAAPADDGGEKPAEPEDPNKP